ncbi:MAG: peroxidase-related enzyme [Chloroflexi bacterium]|nr:peroxidase-related enzyme [Chloroflexota bacterium]
MAYFPIIEYAHVTDAKVRVIYEEISAELGFGMVPNLFKSMALNPDFLETSWRKFRAIVLAGTLPRTLKEMIGVVVSQANHSPYALQVHLHSLSALGISEELLRLLVEDFNHCPLPQRQKATIQFGLLAATQPHNLTDTHYQTLRAMGLNDVELFEIIATANIFTEVNQYTDAIDLEIDRL